MHDFTMIRARNTLHSLALALGGLTLPACPMTDDDTGDASTDAESTTGAATSGEPGETASGEPDATTTDETTSGEPDETTTDATTGPAPTHTLSGTVGRTVELAPGNDGIGTLFVAAFSECGLGQSLLGVAAVPGADLSAADARVAFTLTGLPAGPVHLGLFLDDNGDADPMGPLPHLGDLVYGFDACDGELDCVALEISDADLVDVALDLNLLEVDECR